MTFARSVTATILLATCLLFTAAADEKGDDDKPLKYWVERLASNDAEIRKAANTALSANCDRIFEPPDFDDADKLAKQDRIRAELKLLFSALTKLLDCTHDESRETAAYLLAVIGPDASEAEPALLKFIRSKSTANGLRMAAITALLHVAPRHRAVGPILLEAYTAAGGGKSDDGKEVEKPRVAGGKIDYEEASAGISGFYVALMLTQSGRTTTEVPTLLELSNPKYERQMRITAICALAELESEAKAASPALRKLLSDDDDRSIRMLAGAAFLHIEGNAAEMPGILKAMRLDESESSEFRKSILEFFKQKADLLKWMREESDESVRILLRQLKYENPFYQRQAIRRLGEIGPKSKAAVSLLITATRSDDDATRDAALAALKQIDPTAAPPHPRGNSKKE